MLHCSHGCQVTSDRIEAMRTPDGFRVTLSVSHSNMGTEISTLGHDLSEATHTALLIAQNWIDLGHAPVTRPMAFDR